jgi:hypothetical protein
MAQASIRDELEIQAITALGAVHDNLPTAFLGCGCPDVQIVHALARLEGR